MGNVVDSKVSVLRKPAGRKKKGRSFVTTLDDGAIVLGTIELKGRTLNLSVNSRRIRAFSAPRSAWPNW